MSFSSSLILEGAPAVVIEIVLARPQGLFGRTEDRAVGQRQHVAGHVLIHPDPPRNQDLVTCPHAHEPFVKRPVAETAEGHAVRGPVIPALPSGDNLIVHLCAKVHLLETLHGTHIVLDIRVVPRLGNAVPKAVGPDPNAAKAKNAEDPRRKG
jgi:hypothetical protein